MKKSLLALAVLAAAGAANAQVSIYGTIDASISQEEVGTTTTTKQGSQDYLGSSVLGLRGGEDLGGGLKASFQMEGDLNVNNGTGDGNGQYLSGGATTSAGAGGFTFDRQMWIGVSGGFGDVKVGRTGDAVKDHEGYGYFSNLFDYSGSAASASTNSGGAATTAVGDRNPNLVKYTSPKFAGVTVTVASSNDIKGGNSALDGAGHKEFTYSVDYANGPLKVAVALGSKADSAEGVETTVIGAQYKLGQATLGVSYFKNKDKTAGADANDNKALQFGAKMGLSDGFSVEGNYFDKKGDRTDPVDDFSAWGAMLVKDFSKRTSAYVGYRDTKGETSGVADATVTTIGLQHKF